MARSILPKTCFTEQLRSVSQQDPWPVLTHNSVIPKPSPKQHQIWGVFAHTLAQTSDTERRSVWNANLGSAWQKLRPRRLWIEDQTASKNNWQLNGHSLLDKIHMCNYLLQEQPGVPPHFILYSYTIHLLPLKNATQPLIHSVRLFMLLYNMHL